MANGTGYSYQVPSNRIFSGTRFLEFPQAQGGGLQGTSSNRESSGTKKAENPKALPGDMLLLSQQRSGLQLLKSKASQAFDDGVAKYGSIDAFQKSEDYQGYLQMISSMNEIDQAYNVNLGSVEAREKLFFAQLEKNWTKDVNLNSIAVRNGTPIVKADGTFMTQGELLSYTFNMQGVMEAGPSGLLSGWDMYTPYQDKEFESYAMDKFQSVKDIANEWGSVNYQQLTGAPSGNMATWGYALKTASSGASNKSNIDAMIDEMLTDMPEGVRNDLVAQYYQGGWDKRKLEDGKNKGKPYSFGDYAGMMILKYAKEYLNIDSRTTSREVVDATGRGAAADQLSLEQAYADPEFVAKSGGYMDPTVWEVTFINVKDKTPYKRTFTSEEYKQLVANGGVMSIGNNQYQVSAQPVAKTNPDIVTQNYNRARPSYSFIKTPGSESYQRIETRSYETPMPPRLASTWRNRFGLTAALPGEKELESGDLNRYSTVQSVSPTGFIIKGGDAEGTLITDPKLLKNAYIVDIGNVVTMEERAIVNGSMTYATTKQRTGSALDDKYVTQSGLRVTLRVPRADIKNYRLIVPAGENRDLFVERDGRAMSGRVSNDVDEWLNTNEVKIKGRGNNYYLIEAVIPYNISAAFDESDSGSKNNVSLYNAILGN